MRVYRRAEQQEAFGKDVALSPAARRFKDIVPHAHMIKVTGHRRQAAADAPVRWTSTMDGP